MAKQDTTERTLFELYKESKANRVRFLEAKKQEYIDCEKVLQRKELIAELIQLEPSHLAEPWILDQVIKAMRDRKKNLDFLEAAFVSKGKRNELTEGQRDDLAMTTFMNQRINKELKGARGKVTKEQAAGRVAMKSEDYRDIGDKALLQKLKRYRKQLDKRSLPFPYYGLDFLEIDEGTEFHRVEFYIHNKPITNGAQALFGDTTISIALGE
jgi:hypothetical protein